MAADAGSASVAGTAEPAPVPRRVDDHELDQPVVLLPRRRETLHATFAQLSSTPRRRGHTRNSSRRPRRVRLGRSGRSGARPAHRAAAGSRRSGLRPRTPARRRTPRSRPGHRCPGWDSGSGHRCRLTTTEPLPPRLELNAEVVATGSTCRPQRTTRTDEITRALPGVRSVATGPGSGHSIRNVPSTPQWWCRQNRSRSQCPPRHALPNRRNGDRTSPWCSSAPASPRTV